MIVQSIGNKQEYANAKSAGSALIRGSATTWSMLDTSHWRSLTAVTLTLKQARRSALPNDAASRIWVEVNDVQCKNAFRHFMNLLNRAIYRNAVRRHGKRLRVIAVVEKDIDGRWHIHAAIEPPSHLADAEFETLIRDCWQRTDWGYREIQLGQNADRGWIDYMLKPGQKSGHEQWFDSIDLDSLHNPIADA